MFGSFFFYLGLRLVHIFKILQQIYMHVFIWETAIDVQLYSPIMHFYIAVFFFKLLRISLCFDLFLEQSTQYTSNCIINVFDNK